MPNTFELAPAQQDRLARDVLLEEWREPRRLLADLRKEIAAGRMSQLEAMRAHVERTCEAHSIHVTWTERKAFASFDEERIWIPPIRSAITYATALHEIGHVLGKYKLSKSVLVRERAAWRWARGNALVWTSSMERNRVASLAWYEARSSVV